MKCKYATTARYQTRRPESESTSDRRAYVRFFAIVTAMPIMPLPSSSAAVQSCLPVEATPAPAIARMKESTCHLMECGRKANGCTSVRYTDGNAAVPQTPALMRVPHSDRTDGSGL